ACTGLAANVNARSNLLSSSFDTDNSTFFAYQAQFLIDHLDGDPDKTPEVPDSCLVVTQRYEFYKEGLQPFEPFGFFPSAKFRPLVSYDYFTDQGGPTIQSVTLPQRLHFDARSVQQPGLPPPPSKFGVNDELLACDKDAK